MRSPFLAVVIVAALLHPLAYFSMFAGDASIHLVFAENAAQGHFFEFNWGEKTAGETSPGFMLIVAGLFRLLPASVVPLGVYVLNLAAWYVLLALVYRMGVRLFGDRRWALAAALVAAFLPGSCQNATVGMENGLFAALFLLWIDIAVGWRWFEAQPGELTFRREVLLGLLGGALCWLRPEAIVVAALAHGFRFIRQTTARPGGLARAARAALAAVPMMIVAGALIVFHWAETGHFFPSSALARATLLAGYVIHWGPLRIVPKFGVRLLFYLPLTAFFVIGAANAFRPSRRTPAVVQFMVIVFVAFFALYSSVLGAAQLGRYSLFIMPLFVLVALAAVRSLWLARVSPGNRARSAGYPKLIVVSALWMAIVFAGEGWVRGGLGTRGELFRVMRAPADRRQFSSELLHSLGNPKVRPIVIAYQEVQERYWLDRRFVVRSLDGRVDSALLDFVHDGAVDHLGYLKRQHIAFLAEIPNYNRDSEKWSLARLAPLKPGEIVERGGLRFTRRPGSQVIHVQHDPWDDYSKVLSDIIQGSSEPWGGPS